ncbi:MAG TPA: hypothetical protein VN676_09270 [Steroidobacteraceae bacterium]|jgi:hypothetical protein|nr:hypothetical protein [Steroidobacteraceae bacterium]
MSTPILLAIALVGVYLVDSMHFLRIGEALVLTRSRQLAGLSFGVSFELGGRRPYLPNPLTPMRADFRLAWDTSGAATDSAHIVGEEMRSHLRAVRAVGWIGSLCAIPIVIVAPLALAFAQERIFLAAVAAAVLLAACGCLLVGVRRRALGLSGLQVCSLTFIALVCLPCAPNLARAVTAQRKWTLAAGELPRLGFEAQRSSAIRDQILAALTSARRYVEEESAEIKVIDEQIRLLQGYKP